jgi:hypothetical protein
VILSVVFTIALPTKRLISAEISHEQQLGDKGVAQTLYSYQKLNGFQGKVCTDWQFLGYLPGLAQYYYFQPLDPSSIDQTMLNPDIGYFMTFKSDTENTMHFNKLVLAKDLQIVAISADGNTILYKIINRPKSTKSQ